MAYLLLIKRGKAGSIDQWNLSDMRFRVDEDIMIGMQNISSGKDDFVKKVPGFLI